MNVILYTRVSTEEQKESGYSLQYQHKSLVKYCAMKNYTIIGHYEDDHTGTTFDRPQFNKLKAYAKANKSQVDLILFVKWDRYARNASEAYSMIQLFKSWGIETNASEQPLDASQPESKIMLACYLTLGEIESDKVSVRTKDALHQAASIGKFTHKAPIGYRNFTNEINEKIIIPDSNAPIIIKAFEMYAKNIYSLEDIRRFLKKNQIYRSKTGLKNLLQNVIYAGNIFVAAYKGEKERIVKGQHEGIISEELFNKVQIILKGNSKNISKPKKRDEALPLRGHLKCKICGGNLTGEKAKGNGGYYHYYKCQRKCKERFSAIEAHDSFNLFLNELTISPEVKELYNVIITDVFKQNEEDKEACLKNLKKQLIDVEDKIGILEEEFYFGKKGMTQDSFNRMHEKLTNQIIHFKNQISSLEDTDSNINKYFEFGLSLFTNTVKTYDAATIEIKQKFLGSIFPQKLIYTGKKYRTTIEDNSFLNLLFIINGLGDSGKKKAGKNTGLSILAPQTGLEPVTL